MIEALIGLLAGSSSVAALWLWRSVTPRVKVRKLIRKKYAVTLKGGDGEFAGVLAEMYCDAFVFEDCMTVPTGPNDGAQVIPGRVTVDSDNVAYLQELSNDSV